MVAYDSGNAVMQAWKLDGDELESIWRLDGLAHGGHLIAYPDTRELVVGDWRGPAVMRSRLVRPLTRKIGPMLGLSARARRAALAGGGDNLVVLDLDSGEEKARVEVPSSVQGFLFPAPGFGRDVYYQSLSTIARVAVV